MKRTRTVGLSMCVAFVVGAPALGADVIATWINDLNGGSVWTDVNEWSIGTYPDNGIGGLTYEVIIDEGGSDYVIEVDIDPTVDRMTIGAMQATVRVDDQRLILNDDLLVFSEEAGEALLDVVDGGIVGMTSGVVAVGPAGDDAHGTVRIDGAGSRLNVVESFDVGPAHPIFEEFGVGTLRVGAGAVVHVFGALTIWNRSNVFLDDDGLIIANFANFLGDLHLEFHDLNNFTPMIVAEHVLVSGEVFLDFDPGIAQSGTYQFISAGTIDTGVVFNVDISGVDPALVTLDLENGRFSIASASPGDVNGDGVVDFADVLALVAQWGACGGGCPPSCVGDFDLDCDVDFADLLILLGNWS